MIMSTYATPERTPIQQPALAAVQPKLEVGEPNDKYEQEADAMADRVMQMPSSNHMVPHQGQNNLQLMPDEEEGKVQMMTDEEEKMQMKPLATAPLIQRAEELDEEVADIESAMDEKKDKLQAKCEDCEEKMQRKPISRYVDEESSTSDGLAQQLSSSKGGGQSLPTTVQREMGQKMGAEFNGVKIHTDSKAVQMNREIGAKAFTHGNDIYFNKGEYSPGTNSGKHLLAHELTHTIQQGAAGKVNPKIQRKCDVKSAIWWYKNTKSGRKIKWTSGLVAELYKVVGTSNKALYDSALKSGAIDASFIALVCKAQAILGFTGDDVDGKIGTNTITAWDKWKTGGKKGIDYGRLLKDKKLEIGVGIGEEYYRFGYQDLKKYLIGQKFNRVVTAKKETYTLTKNFKVQGDNTAAPVPIQVIIDLIHEKSTDPKKTFEEFITKKEIMLYSGHARYGTGPDFDPKKSVAQNFVIGVNSALHRAGKLTKGYDAGMRKILKGKANDLERLSKAGKFDPNLYQVWFFDTCKAINYLDEIRGGLVTDKAGNKKPKTDLRVFGTKQLVYPDPMPIIKGLMEMKTMEEIIQIMQARQEAEVKSRGETVQKNYYFAD